MNKDGTVAGDTPEALTTTDLYDRIAHNLFSINVVWTMVTGFLVMFMQAGFMLVETGLCRAKNAAHTASMNLMIYPLGCLAFWAYGFAIGWGNWYNGPVAPGWYSSLGPGTSVLNQGIGIEPDSNAPGKLRDATSYGVAACNAYYGTVIRCRVTMLPTPCATIECPLCSVNDAQTSDPARSETLGSNAPAAGQTPTRVTRQSPPELSR